MCAHGTHPDARTDTHTDAQRHTHRHTDAWSGTHGVTVKSSQVKLEWILYACERDSASFLEQVPMLPVSTTRSFSGLLAMPLNSASLREVDGQQGTEYTLNFWLIFNCFSSRLPQCVRAARGQGGWRGQWVLRSAAGVGGSLLPGDGGVH